MKMSMQDLAHEFVLPLWNHKALEVIDTFVAPAADIQTTFLKGLGPNVLKYNAEQVFNAFSAFEFTIEETLQQENKFIYRWSSKAVHTGIILKQEPTGETLFFSGITSIEIRDGIITRYHCFSDLPRVLNVSMASLLVANLSNLFSSNIDNIILAIKEVTGKRLTKREIECLRLWIKGYSIKETAKTLGGLSNRTIQTFRENIKRKLSVETYQELVSLIQNNGIMPFLL